MTHEHIIGGEQEASSWGVFRLSDGRIVVVRGRGAYGYVLLQDGERGEYVTEAEAIVFTPANREHSSDKSYFIFINGVEGMAFKKKSPELVDVYVPYGPYYSEEIPISQS